MPRHNRYGWLPDEELGALLQHPVVDARGLGRGRCHDAVDGVAGGGEHSQFGGDLGELFDDVIGRAHLGLGEGAEAGGPLGPVPGGVDLDAARPQARLLAPANSRYNPRGGTLGNSRKPTTDRTGRGFPSPRAWRTAAVGGRRRAARSACRRCGAGPQWPSPRGTGRAPSIRPPRGARSTTLRPRPSSDGSGLRDGTARSRACRWCPGRRWPARPTARRASRSAAQARLVPLAGRVLRRVGPRVGVVEFGRHRDDVIAFADVVLRFMRTPSFLVRHVDLNLHVGEDAVANSFSVIDGSGMSLAERLAALASARARPAAAPAGLTVARGWTLTVLQTARSMPPCPPASSA